MRLQSDGTCDVGKRLDYHALRGLTFEPITQRYDHKDTILYALGVGARPDDLDLVYEKDLHALPTMAVTLATGQSWVRDVGLDYRRALHGEQRLTVHRPLPASGTVIGSMRIDEIYDKGVEKGAVAYSTRTLHDAESGELLVTLGSTAFLRGDGGIGGPRDGAPVPYAVPSDRTPDASTDVDVPLHLAAIYRLSGDWNPLHIDPAAAQAAGFDKPILHGLCTYGVAGRALMRLLCANDPARLRRLDVRFARPVWPGDSLRIDVWRTGANVAAFRCSVPARQTVVLDHGCFAWAD